MTAEAAVAKGSILAYRVLDVGELVAIEAAEELVPSARRVIIGGPPVEGAVIAVRPLEFAMPERELVVPGIPGPLRARVTARIFEFGAISILFEIPIEPGTELSALTPVCAALYESPVLDAHGLACRQEIIQKLGPTITSPHDWKEIESYTIIFIEELAGAVAESLVHSEAAAKLLLGEQSAKPLSVALRDDILRNAFSYLADDLVLIDWNSAVVVEPSRSRVVPHVLELATCQLLEFRYYDGLLDRQLNRVYGEVDRAPRILRSPFGARSRLVLRRFMELTEFTEAVDNAIKFVGDFYLARVYLAAIRRFRVPEWRESVEAKLGLVGRTYELLKGEVEVSRMQILELIVVILIFVEILAALRGD